MNKLPQKKHKKIMQQTHWIYLITVLNPIKKNCRCYVKRSVIRLRCRCKKPRTSWGRCVRGFKRQITRYAVLIRHRCIKRQKSRRCACSCPKKIVRRGCRGNGVRYITVVRFYLQRSSCPRRCLRRSYTSNIVVRCSVRRFSVALKCSKKTCRRSVKLVVYGYDKKNCKCSRKVIYRKRTCCCPGPKISARKCVSHKNWHWTITYSRLRNYRCYRFTVHKRKRIYCGKTTRRYSSCKKNGYKYTTYFYRVARNCQCKVIKESRKRICSCGRIPKYRTRKSTRCTLNGRSWRMVTIYYILKNGRCYRRVRVQYRHVRCHGVRKRATCNKRNCVKSVYTYVRRPKKCKCKFVLRHRNNRSRCCCPKPRFVRSLCVNHRIRRLVYRRYVLSRGVCRPQYYRKDRIVGCSRKRITLRVCSKVRNNCSGVLLLKAYRAINCKCQLRTYKRISIRCCCSKNSRRRRCVSNRIWVTTVVTNVLKNHRCLSRTTYAKRFVRCRRRACSVRFTKCKNNFQYRIVRCQRSVRCRCQLRVISRKRRRCSCVKRSQTRSSGCNRATCFKTYFIRIYSFNKKIRKCYWKLIRRWNVRCCCKRKITKRYVCVNHVIKRMWYSIRVFDRRRKVCRYVVEKRDRRIKGCSRRTRLLRVARGACNRLNGYRILRKQYVNARKCNCRKFIRRLRVPCNCNVIHPPKRWRGCKNNVWISTRVTYGLRGYKCYRRVYKKSLVVRCNRGIRVITKRCSRNAWFTRVLFRRLVARNCRCRWTTYSSKKKPCRCRRKLGPIRCIRNVWNKQQYVSYIRGYRCYYRSVVKKVKVNCKVGTVVRKSKCFGKNKYVITRITKYRQLCKCRRRVRKRLCHCRCPKPVTLKRCQNYRITIRRIYYVRKGCRCHRRVRSTARYPKCPRIRYQTITKCIRRGVVGIRYIIRRSHVRNRRICTCTVKTTRKLQVCWCKRQIRKTKVCIKNRWIYTHYRKQRGRKTCVWRRYARRVVRVRCSRRKTLTSSCNKKTRLRTYTVISYKLNKCGCVRKVFRRAVTCSCRPGRTYVFRSKCNRRTCKRSSKYYTLRLTRNKCVKVFKVFVKRCCCHKLKTIRRCQPRYGRFITIKRWYIFSNGRCIYRRRITYRYVKCSTQVRKSRRCLKNCVNRIVIQRHLRRGCKCQWRVVRRLIRKCCCPKRSVKVICQHQLKRRYIRITTYRLQNGRCRRSVRVRYVGIRCRKQTRRVICTKTGIRIVIRIWFTVSKSCVCLKHIHRHRNRCGCKAALKRRYRCNKRRGIKFTYTYRTILRNYRCVRVSKIVSRRIVCSRKRWITRAKCVKGRILESKLYIITTLDVLDVHV